MNRWNKWQLNKSAAPFPIKLVFVLLALGKELYWLHMKAWRHLFGVVEYQVDKDEAYALKRELAVMKYGYSAGNNMNRLMIKRIHHRAFWQGGGSVARTFVGYMNRWNEQLPNGDEVEYARWAENANFRVNGFAALELNNVAEKIYGDRVPVLCTFPSDL